MHFQIWFPGVSGGAAAALKGAGLPDFVEGCRESMAKFDDGRIGLMVSWTGDVGYLADRQTWVPLDAKDGPLVGFWNGDPCTPEDLKRRSLFSGYSQRLADGLEWVIPLAAELPSTLKLVDQKWKKIRKPQFDEFWARSEPWYRRFMKVDLDLKQIAELEGIDPDALLHDWVDFCVFALRQNYRIAPAIASHMGLLDTNSLIGITFSVVDGMAIKEVIEELQYKADADSAFEKKAEACSTSG